MIVFGAMYSNLSALPVPPKTTLFFRFVLRIAGNYHTTTKGTPVPTLTTVVSFNNLSMRYRVVSCLECAGLGVQCFCATETMYTSFSTVVYVRLLGIFPYRMSIFTASDSMAPTTCSISMPTLTTLLVVDILLVLRISSSGGVY